MRAVQTATVLRPCYANVFGFVFDTLANGHCFVIALEHRSLRCNAFGPNDLTPHTQKNLGLGGIGDVHKFSVCRPGKAYNEGSSRKSRVVRVKKENVTF